MPRAAPAIVEGIRRFEPTGGDWLALDRLLGELFQAGAGPLGIDAMPGVLERFPADDGAGVFRGIVHGRESRPGYEGEVIKSVRRARCEFSALMVGRLLNAGVEEAGDVRLVPVLREVTGRRDATPEARRIAQDFREKHGD
jgi:hypothetical protein